MRESTSRCYALSGGASVHVPLRTTGEREREPESPSTYNERLGAVRETNLVELAGKGHEEEGQLEHHCHDQRDEEQVVIVRDWRTHVPRNVLESAPKQQPKRHTDLRRQEVARALSGRRKSPDRWLDSSSLLEW